MLRSAVFLLIASLCFGVTPFALAEVKPHGLFSDNMLLQREIPINVWGTAANDEKVTVAINDQTVSTVAKDGKWLVQLKPLTAGGPTTLTITGSNTIELKNVLIGDVWICSGQSNMEMTLNNCATGPADVKQSTNAKLRLYNVPRHGKPEPQDDVVGTWSECNPQTTPNFSGVAYYFGRALQAKLDVPIGLINTNVGGTPAEAWTSQQALEAEPATAVYLKRRHSDLYNAMIHPLQNYGIRGAIWYQGESNAGEAYLYRKLFPTMITNWRAAWKQGDFPFLFVQLAPYEKIVDAPGPSRWAELREAQLLTAQNLPKTGMAVITDVGDEKDIHPKRKQPAGERLALAARAIAYGEKIEYSGPVYQSMSVDGANAVIKFTHLGQGLKSEGDQLTGFTIAGEDKAFHNARAKIEGDTVVVSSPDVAKPVAVRYGWNQYPVVNLWNKDGLPATPFRTDDFLGVTQPKTK